MTTASDSAQVVVDINTDVWNALLARHRIDLAILCSLTYKTDGNWEGIDFLGHGIWDNQDDDVPWDDEKGAPVRSLKDHLLLRMQKTVEDLAPLAAFCKENMAVTG